MVEDGATPEPRTQVAHAHTLVKALQTVPSLGVCDEQTLLEIVGGSVNLVWPAGDTVFQNGTPSSGLFIVLSGRVRVVASSGEELAELGPGEHFGELSLLFGTTHQHTVKTLEDSELMVLPKECFDVLLADNRQLADAIRLKADERMAMNRGETASD